MARPQIEAVSTHNIDEFCGFLKDNLNPRVSLERWRFGLTQDWGTAGPNHGFLVRDAGRIVGGIGAIYVDRVFDGRNERFCNITSWCVLDSHRQQSMRLAMAVTGQPGYHFTDFSPTAVVASMLRFLKFQVLDERQAVLLNLPWMRSFGPRAVRVVDDPAAIEQLLRGEALQRYRDHQRFPWLHHLVLGHGDHWCHIVYKRRRFKNLPAAWLLYVADADLLDRGWRPLGAHLLARGMVSTHVELRHLAHLPRPHAIRSGFNPKLYLSSSLEPSKIDELYSESVTLDL